MMKLRLPLLKKGGKMKVFLGIVLGLILFGSIGSALYGRLDLCFIGILIVILGSIVFKAVGTKD